MARHRRRPPGFITALRGSGAAAPFVASLIGRLPMGAVGLVFILRTNEITGSFARRRRSRRPPTRSRSA